MTEELSKNQKEMVADLLIRTKTKADIKENSYKIIGNAYGDKNTVKVYRELATMKVNLKR